MLLGFLDYLRSSVAAKTEGVPEPQVRTARVGSGTSFLGLVKHLIYVERYTFLGENVTDWHATFRPEPGETADARAGGRPLRIGRSFPGCTRPKGPPMADYAT